MQPRPNAVELIAAVRDFLESEIVPTLGDARLKFRTLVAINALGIVEREHQLEEGFLRAELADLSNLLEANVPIQNSLEELRLELTNLNADLAQRIRTGNAPAAAFETLKRAAVNKLRVSSPTYLKRYSL